DYGNTEKIVLEILECDSMGITVLPPSVNESYKNFTYIDANSIRFGLAAIKGIGDAPAEEIIIARADKPFENLENFISRVPQKVINKKTIEALAYSGAMDEFGERKQIAESVEDITNFAKYSHKTKNEGQTDIFGMLDTDEEEISAQFQLKDVEPANNMDKLKWEKEYLGLYVSSHPLQGLKKYFRKKAHLISNLTKKDFKKPITIGGIITQYRKIFTKSGTYMASFIIEDPTGKLDVIVFPKAYQKYGHLFAEDFVIVMGGKLDDRRGQVQFVCDEAKAVSLENMIKKAKEDGIYNPEEKVVLLTPDFSSKKEEVQVEESPVEAVPEVEKVATEKPFIVDIPANCDTAVLNTIKQVLLDNKGKTPCEIHIRQNGSIKKIKVPFGINSNDTLDSKLKELIPG
ncbi:OB-fold nucleic acid binding domain-containing protein, partial [Patescibacteria group bacterium]